MLYVASMNIRPLARRALTLLPIALLAALAFSASASAATNEIEGVWSFNGGSVAIERVAGGETFQGKVETETKFDECPHVPGEIMWTNMKEGADGSFWGLHQWFHAGCKAESTFVGPTAWRVLHNAKGGRYLKVCFSRPGGDQPEIAPSGVETKPSGFFGCYESSLIEPLPTSSGSGSGGSGVLSTTTTKACVSQSTLKLKLKDSKNDPLKQVVISVNGKKVAAVKGVKAINKALKKGGITLTKLPSGTYKISVTATTVLHKTLTGSQTYKSCTNGSGSIGLKKAKHHHG
jgi:hypothetical protein